MIRAHKRGPIAALLSAYVHRKFRRAFRGLWLRGELPRDDSPLLVYANHSNFWDGFVAFELCRLAGWDGYCAMEEKTLASLPFLARIGAFSIRRGDSTSSLETLRYARHLLKTDRTAVFLFPEGQLRPFAPGPLALERGVEVLARSARVQCLPLCFRYLFVEHELPDVLVEVGEPHRPGPVEEFSQRLQRLVDRSARVYSVDGFTQGVVGARGLVDRWARAP